jgi:integrase
MPKLTTPLTDAAIKKLPIREVGYKTGDGHGLSIFTTPHGTKIWRGKYVENGKDRVVVYGNYPDVSLKEARILNSELRARLARGERPDIRIGGETTAKPVKQPTLAQAIERWLEHHGRSHSPAYIQNIRYALEAYIVPALGNIQLDAVTRKALLTELLVLDAAGRMDYVRKVRIWVEMVYKYMIHLEECETNPAGQIDPKVAFAVQRKANFPSLPLKHVPDFWRLVNRQRVTQSQLGCRLLALTWVRTDELVGSKWSDIEGDVLRIPGGRMKMNLEHWVPLSRQAKAILAELKQRAGESEFILPGIYRRNQPMSNDAILHFIYDLGYKGRMCGHGWRHVASTWANEQHREDGAKVWDRAYTEMALAHVEGGVSGIYNAAEYLPQRRMMLQSYADWLDAGLTPLQPDA